MPAATERRRHPRFSLPGMYTPVAVRLIDEGRFRWAGHAYDISEGGMRFELDRALEPGTCIVARIALPGGDEDDSVVFAFGTIVWLEDEDDPAPYRMAAVFTRFAREGDRELLHERLSSGRFATAA
jgi:hypothetical protein